MTDLASRRAFLGTTLATAAVAAGLGARDPAAARLAGIQDEPPLVGESRSPTWVFVVHSVQDPYAGVLVRPAEPQAGMRYVAADVEIRNESTFPLEFGNNGVRLVGGDGVEYPSGLVAGSEPALPIFTLEPANRMRGWVWYAVPEVAPVVGLVHYGPRPRLPVPLPPAG